MKKALTILFLLSMAALAGFMLPTTNSFLRPFNTILSLLFGILSWNVFYLSVPTRYFYRPKWMRVRIVVVPLLWIALIVLLTVFLSQIPSEERLQNEKLAANASQHG